MIPLPDFLTTGRASCTRHDPDLFTTCTPANVKKAKPICGGCPLLVACQRWAIDNQEPIGVWGGLTPSERVQLRRGPGWWADDDGRIRVPCGTVEALGAHRGYGETCQPCETAEQARVTEQRRAALEREHDRLKGGSRRGAELHRLLGEELCPKCQRAEQQAASKRKCRERAARAGARPMALAS
jgi:ssDNA-binding Zn-finger/Zn-ribbon topoisomerase 1